MYNLKSSFELKASLLTQGCKVSSNTQFSDAIALKKIHLYSHSPEKTDKSITEDVMLPNEIISRVRYRTTSHLTLESHSNGYQIKNDTTQHLTPVSCIASSDFSNVLSSGVTNSQVCAHLGCDLLGITPSNYCFYFQNGSQCKFCEILPTYKSQVEYPKSLKSVDVIVEAVSTAFARNPHLRFLAITTGNFKSYDAVFDYFAQIGQKLQKDPNYPRIEQNLATLMPPQDLKKISLLKEYGFTKIYFPLEVFDRTHFEKICPGKAEYGYDNILRALDEALRIFGKGNVYTNFVYGNQSIDASLNPNSYDPQKENELSIKAVEGMLSMGVIPAFTVYHYGGYNAIGDLQLDTTATIAFFKQWGQLVLKSKIVPDDASSVIFGPLTLSNTLFNDGFRLAKQEK